MVLSFGGNELEQATSAPARTKDSGSVSLPPRLTRSTSKRAAVSTSVTRLEDGVDATTIDVTSLPEAHLPLMASTETKTETPSAIAENTSKKSKEKKNKSRQDVFPVSATSLEILSRMEERDQEQKKKLRSHGTGEQSGGPSVPPAKNKRAKRKRAEDEEDALSRTLWLQLA